MYVEFDAPHADTAAIYHVVPVLMAHDVTAGTTAQVPLSSLSSTLVFATQSQFTCYGLDGNHVWRVVTTPVARNNDCL